MHYQEFIEHCNGVIVEIIPSNKGVYIGFCKKGIRSEVFVEAAWTICAFTHDDGSVGEAHFCFMHRKKMAIAGTDNVTRLCFHRGRKENFFLEINDTEIPVEKIQKLNFYARTDAGSMLICINPTHKLDGREYVAYVTRKKKISQVMQAIAQDWLSEVFKTNSTTNSEV